VNESDKKYMDESNKQIKIGAIISYTAIFINVITSLIYLPWMTQKIGQANYGLYTLANSFVSMFLIDFGLSSAIARFLAKYRAEKNINKENIVFAAVTKLYLVIDCGIFIILIIAYLFLDLIYKGLTPDEIQIFKQLYVVVAVFSIISFPCMSLNGIMTAHEKFIEAKICDLGQKLVSILLMIIALCNNLGVVAVVTANAVSGVLFIIVKIFLVNRNTKVRFDFLLKDKKVTKEILSFSIWTAISSICQRFYFSFAPTILGIVSNSHEIAVFSPANALEGYFYMFAAAVNGLFLAKISRYIAEDKEDRIYSLMVKIGRYQLFVMGLIFIGYICIGHEFIIQWMGKDYEKAYYCGIFLFIPDLLGFTQQIGNTTIIAKNKVKPSAIGYLISTIVCVILSFYLSRIWGSIGASIAIAVGYFIAFLNANRIYYKYLNIPIFDFFKECFGTFIVPDVLSIIIGIFIQRNIIIKGWLGIGVKGFLLTLVYFILTLCFSLNTDERSIMRKIVVHIRRK